MNKIVCFVLGAIGLAIAVISAVVLSQFPHLVKNKIEKQLVISEGSDSFTKFKDPGVPIYLKLHFFNVNNPDEVIQGARPNVTEMGPYTYLEQRVKNIEQFEDGNDIVTYTETKTYIFQPHLSNGNLSDEVTLANVPALAAVAQTFFFTGEDEGQIIRSVMNQVFEKTKTFLFEKHTIEEVAFKGYNLTFIEALNELLVEEKKPPVNLTEFAFFINQNATDDGVYQVHTGSKDISELLSIQTWNNESEVTYWNNGSSCNKIVGTDGSGFAPNVKKDSQLKIFNTELCRSFSLEFDSKEKVKGIETDRFIIPAKAFQGPEKNPDNQCYCLKHDWSNCSHNGLLDISSCRQDAPLVGSSPHFFEGDDSLYEAIDGLAKPSADKDQTYLNIEPMTGKCLKAAKRLQISLVLTPKLDIGLTANVEEVMLPTLWVEESFEVSDELADEFKSKVTKSLRIGTGLLITGLVVGTLLIVGGLGVFFYDKYKRAGNSNERLIQ